MTESDYQSYAGGEQPQADEGASGEFFFHYQPRQEHSQKDGKFFDAVDGNGICAAPPRAKRTHTITISSVEFFLEKIMCLFSAYVNVLYISEKEMKRNKVFQKI